PALRAAQGRGARPPLLAPERVVKSSMTTHLDHGLYPETGHVDPRGGSLWRSPSNRMMGISFTREGRMKETGGVMPPSTCRPWAGSGVLHSREHDPRVFVVPLLAVARLTLLLPGLEDERPTGLLAVEHGRVQLTESVPEIRQPFIRCEKL